VALTPTQEFCARLQRIVMLLEQRNWAEAAAAAAAMEKLVSTLPLELPPDELSEARQLLAKYETLGAGLRERTLAAMTQLGAARRARAYARRAHRP
jgi:hypothetical protein